jgi:predicted enzyme related to lactoylglutathione lyase
MLKLIILGLFLTASGFTGGYFYGNAKTSNSADKKVTGIGGIFFKCKDPKTLKEWYNKNLGLNTDQYGTNFEWRLTDNPEKKGFLLWAPFKETTTYFAPSEKAFMINYRVSNMERLLEQLKAAGIHPVDTVEKVSYGKFVHIMDPEGNKIELWEPNDAEYGKVVNGKVTY